MKRATGWRVLLRGWLGVAAGVAASAILASCAPKTAGPKMVGEVKAPGEAQPAPAAPGPSVLMVDPALDDTGPFCYLAKPCSQIAVPGVTHGTQFTFDGSLYTGAAELCFYSGAPLRPLLARQKEMLEGWIPVFLYGWIEGPIEHHLEVFGSLLDDGPTTNAINFVRVRMRNAGTTPARAPFAAATRFDAHDHRFKAMRQFPFSADWRYEMRDDAVVRDGKLICLFPAGAEREAVPGEAYSQPFIGRDRHVSERAEVCMVRLCPTLNPGETATLEFRMPRAPIPIDNARLVDALRGADYDVYRQRWVDTWKATLSRGTQISVPEKKVMDAWRANLVHSMTSIGLATRGQRVQSVNKFQYNHFWLRDGERILRGYEVLGQNDLAADLLGYFLQFQKPNGNFLSQEGQLDGFGQTLYALGTHYQMTGDVEFARRIYKQIPPAVAWLKNARAGDEFHIMPSTTVMDNEFITGRYTGDNFWALPGLRQAILLARATGHDADAEDFLREYADFRQAFLRRLDAVCGKDGYIPPGLDVKGGQDWGNLLGVVPAEILDPFDPRVTTTQEKMHREKYAEGIMTYMGKLHHYVTTNVTETHVARKEQEAAVEGLYWLLQHTDSTHGGFEWTANPWGERDVGGNFPPHACLSGKLLSLLRNMLVVEQGGEGGLEGRDLHFFSAISPAWAIPGEEVTIRKAPTELGTVSAVLRFTATGAEFTLDPQFRRKPTSVVLHVPYFVVLDEFKTDASSSRLASGGIVLSPDVTWVTLTWARRPTKPLSFDHVVEEYKKEYRRRYEAYRAAGNEPCPVEAPRLLTGEERARDFGALEPAEDKGIAVGNPVTTNGGEEANHGPERAVDGEARDLEGSSWWAGPPTPRWLQIDLQGPVRIGAVHVFPYWDYGRFYQYVVDVSLDGQAWTRVGDRSRNTKPAEPSGDRIEFSPVDARYVRVTLLYNSANSSVHLVEVRVFPAKTAQ